MPLVTFFIVAFHETCLTVMIADSNLLIVSSIVCIDVFENVYCLYSLARVMRQKRVRSVTIVIPESSENDERNMRT